MLAGWEVGSTHRAHGITSTRLLQADGDHLGWEGARFKS